MNLHIQEAARAWVDPTKAKVIGKPALLAEASRLGRVPSADEEASLGLTVEAIHIPPQEWGAVCLLAERVRAHAAETSLADEASQQVADAARFLNLTSDDFLRWPWRDLDELVGGMAPGTVHFVVCPSKGGKTTLCRSAAAHWIRAGKRVYYAGLEMKATALRTMYAADDCGVDPGDVMSGAWLHFAHYPDLRARMADAYHRQDDPTSEYQRLRFSGFASVNRQAVDDLFLVVSLDVR